MPVDHKDRVRKVVPRSVDLLSELLRRNHNRADAVPLLRLEDVLRDKKTNAAIH